MLIAWQRMTQPREARGLGFKDCTTHSMALLTKWVTKAIDNPQSEWASLLLELSGHFTWEHKQLLNHARYTTIDHLFFNIVKSFGGQTYMMGLWKSWATLRRHLTISPKDNLIPTHWRTTEMINSLLPFANREADILHQLNITLGKLSITKVAHLWDDSIGT